MKKKNFFKGPLALVISLLTVLLGNVSYAQSSEEENKAADRKAKIEAATRQFAGLNFGVGLTLTLDTGNNDRVENAELVNGIVRVTEERNDIPRIMLETHYFFMPNRNFLWMMSVPWKEWGVGPFVGIQNGSNEIIEAIAAGVMLGFRRNAETTDSFNLGIGMVVDPSVKILGDGMKENRTLPVGETQIRYKKTSQWGVLLLCSYAF